MEQETNSLGEVYYWEYTETQRKSWDETDVLWDSPSATRPWDSFGAEGGWKVSTQRTLHVGGNRTIHIHLDQQSRLLLSNFNFRNSNAVLSDVEFNDNAINFTQFKEIAQYSGPVGYDEIRPLIPGEYTYQDALVGIRLRVYNAESTLGIYGAVLNVDVEDVVDKGQVTVTSTNINNPTVVRFNKHYYRPPEELMFTVSNFAEPCVVKVIENSLTATQFQLMLESTVTAGRYVTGTVMWMSNGY